MVCLKEAVILQLREVVNLRLREAVMGSHQPMEVGLVSKKMGYLREKAYPYNLLLWAVEVATRVWIRVASVLFPYRATRSGLHRT